MNKSKINLNSTKAWVTFITIGVLLVTFTTFWIMSSYHSVTFKYDSERGSVTLINPSSRDSPIPISAGQPLTLRSGDYIVKRHGENIIESEQTITVSQDEEIEINIYYSEDYLSQLYDFERVSIRSTLFDKYPKIQEIYNISNDRLYFDGKVFGATLNHIDDSDQNRDPLKVLMVKEAGEWKLLTSPPAPIISQPLYPDIPIDTITQINRGR